jgi:hypothetical protein
MPSRARIAVFFLANLLLSSWYLDTGHNDNTMSRAALVSAMVDRGTFHIDAYERATADKAQVGDHYFSDKAPLPALIVAPLWWLIHSPDPTEYPVGSINDDLLRLGGFIGGSIPLALIITLIWLSLGFTRINVRWHAPVAMLPVLGSFLFVYSGSFYAHMLGACLLLLAVQARDRSSYSLMGLWCGAAVLCEYTLAVIPMVLIIPFVVARLWSVLLRIAIGAAPFVALLIAHNLLTTGHPFELLYAHEVNYTFMKDAFGFHLPSLEALWGLTFSAYRGLLPYMPALFVLLVHTLISLFGSDRRWPRIDVIAALVNILVIGAYAMWWGGWAYGPRHLSAAAVLLLTVGLPRVIMSRPWIFALTFASCVGVIMSWAAKSTAGYSLPTEDHAPLSNIILPQVLRSDWSAGPWIAQLGFPLPWAVMLFPVLCLLITFTFSRWDEHAARTDR